MMHADDTRACVVSHLGVWAMHPLRLQQALSAIQQGLWRPATIPQAFDQEPARRAAVPERERRYRVMGDQVAVIRMVGAITKGYGKFTDTSTIQARMAIRQALRDEDVQALLLAVDSPGGQVAGVQDLADEVRRATLVKPVAAYYEDLAASAALWASVYAQRITANRGAEVGSIGVFAVLQDLSGLAEREGVTVRVISTGPYKGLGAPGTPVTPELVDEVQAHVDTIGGFFFEAVQQGRALSGTRLAQVTDGRTWIGTAAQERGLVDGIETFEQALEAARRLRPRRRMATQQAALDEHRAALAAARQRWQ